MLTESRYYHCTQTVDCLRHLNQDGSAVNHYCLPSTEPFLHQKQIGLCDVMSFADSAHRETLAHAFKELLPF